MATRGAIAYKVDSGWEGVYVHNYAYPSDLGNELIKRVKFYMADSKSKKDAISEVIREIKQHPFGYSVFPDEPFVHHPVSDKEKPRAISNNDPDPLFMEYVYILDPKNECMKILACNGVGGLPQPTYNKEVRILGDKWDYGHCIYWHEDFLTSNFEEELTKEAVEAKESTSVFPKQLILSPDMRLVAKFGSSDEPATPEVRIVAFKGIDVYSSFEILDFQINSLVREDIFNDAKKYAAKRLNSKRINVFIELIYNSGTPEEWKQQALLAGSTEE